MSIKICFLWVEQFRNLRDFNFNLDSSQKFHYDKSEHRVTRKNLEPLPRDFFPNSVSEVTALVGKNGVGKSNALELICTILKASESNIKFEFILIYKDEEGLNCVHKSGEKGKPKSDTRLKYREFGGIDTLKVIFYSNVFAERDRRFTSGVVDISPDHMHRPGYALGDKTTQLRRQIWFINNDCGFNELGIAPPTHVSINVDRILRDPSITRDTGMEFKDFVMQYRKRLRSLSVVNRFICSFSLAYFLRFLAMNRRGNWRQPNPVDDAFSELPSLLEGILDYSTREISDRLLTYTEQISAKDDFSLDASSYRKNITIDRETIHKQINWIRSCEDWIRHADLTEQSSEFRSIHDKTFNVGYDANTNKHIEKLLSLFEDLSFFSMNWIGISSGQRAYLNLFSLIAYELKHSHPSPVFLCVDEGDLYLHPKWQIEFFKQLLGVLSKSSSGMVQLLLTSHSPFLLADLPKQNISILTSDAAQISVDGWTLDRETFCGNLYDLYAGPLFIDTLKTSMFAQEKVSELAQAAQKHPLSISRKNVLKKLLNLVGDDILKMVIAKDLNDD